MEPKITLHPFDLSDASVAAVMRWASDDRVTRFQRRDSFTHVHQALRHLQTHILPHPFYRAISLDGAIAGSITVTPCEGTLKEGNVRRASIGYRLAYEEWGKGIATAALGMVVKEVFESWEELERLEAMADVENVGSRRVLEKCGFTREAVLRRYLVLKGEVRDMVMFSIVRGDLVLGVG